MDLTELWHKAASAMHFDLLTAFGLFAVSAMLIFYALEETGGRVFILGFAAACLMGSAYGFLQGAWPFGIVEGVWAVVAFRKWVRKGNSSARAGGNPTPLASSVNSLEADQS